MKRIKIGVFDSGIGGITVLSELRKRLNFVDYVYLGDTAHVPYGTKSPSQIEKLSLDCIRVLKEKKIDALVIACNTSCAWAFSAIEKLMHPIPVFGVVSPGVEAALAALQILNQPDGDQQKQRPILVLATRATVLSHAYGKILDRILNPFGDGALTPVIEQACPLLVPIIEEGWVDHPILHQTILEYVRPYLEKFSPGVALLGCTHYPWIHSAFERALPGWTIVNSAQAITECLESSDLMKDQAQLRTQVAEKLPAKESKSQIEWIFTDPLAVSSFAQQWVQGWS